MCGSKWETNTLAKTSTSVLRIDSDLYLVGSFLSLDITAIKAVFKSLKIETSVKR